MGEKVDLGYKFVDYCSEQTLVTHEVLKIIVKLLFQ